MEYRYPEEFVEKVKAAWPDNEKLHQALDQGSDEAVRILEDNRSFEMEPREIVAAFEDGRQDEVLALARRCVKMRELYQEWFEVVRPQARPK